MVAMRRNKKDDVKEPVQQEQKILDVNATMQGALRFDDPVNLRINGKFEGTLDTKGTLTIGNKASIRANITGEIINIEGNVNGNIKASKLLSLAKTAKLNGDVETSRLSVDEGAILIGQVRMENGAQEAVPVDSDDVMDSYQVAEYVGVETKKVLDWATSGILPGVVNNGVWSFEKSKVDEWVAAGKVKA